MGLHLKWEKNGPGKMPPTGLRSAIRAERRKVRQMLKALAFQSHGLGVIPELCTVSPVSWVLNGWFSALVGFFLWFCSPIQWSVTQTFRSSNTFGVRWTVIVFIGFTACETNIFQIAWDETLNITESSCQGVELIELRLPGEAWLLSKAPDLVHQLQPFG